MLVALAHLKAEFIRGRNRGERGYYVSAAAVREKERERGPFYLSRTRISPGADITRLRRRVKPRHVGMLENESMVH